jgi:hypothetical protein
MQEPLSFCGRTFRTGELELMRLIAQEFAALGVTEIARTICELLEWKRPGGGLKNHECRQLLEQLLEQLAVEGFLPLPELRKRGGRGPRRADVSTPYPEPALMECAASECEPLEIALVEGPAESRRWREWLERYHYLDGACPSGRTCVTGHGIANGNWLVCCGPRRPRRCRRGIPGLVGVTSSGSATYS